MKFRIPDYYDKFKCIGSDCTDSCCAGWDITVNDETYEKYTLVKGSFGDRLMRFCQLFPSSSFSHGGGKMSFFKSKEFMRYLYTSGRRFPLP